MLRIIQGRKKVEAKEKKKDKEEKGKKSRISISGLKKEQVLRRKYGNINFFVFLNLFKIFLNLFKIIIVIMLFPEHHFSYIIPQAIF